MKQLRTYIKDHRWLLLGFFLSALIVRGFWQHTETAARREIVFSPNHLQQIAVQLNQAEARINEKEAALGRLYKDILYTRGRFTCQTIVMGNPSRLSLADSTPKPSRSARQSPVSPAAAYMRYTDMDFDITMPSAVTARELDNVFYGTALYGLGKDFISAELATGINAIFLSALAVHESSWGQSQLARENNNLFGFGAYDSTPGMAKEFSSKGASIAFVARFLRDHYIEGSYYRGRSVKSINTLYSTDPNWSKNIFLTMLKIDSTIRRNVSQ